MKDIVTANPVSVLDYKPSFKKHFFELAGNWLSGMLNGKLEKEDEFSLHNPEKAYIKEGGFVFFAFYKNKPIGCVALKRISETNFEFCKLYVNADARNMGVATRLIERCITRCKENKVKQLFLQTTNELRTAHQLYYKLGFKDVKAPKEMDVLKRTEKIMALEI